MQEMTAGRLLSPVFGSLAVVLSFFIGKNLFNRNVGILASVLFMFYDMWIWYSRTIMMEAHYIFFLLLSLLLLLHAFKAGQTRISFLVLSAISFGIALDFKLLAVSFSGLFFCLILFEKLSRRQPNLSVKHRVGKAAILILSFFIISALGMLATDPGFYQNPINQIKILKSDMDNYNHDVWYIGYPSIGNLQIKSLVSIFHFTIFPSFLEEMASKPKENLSNNFGWTYPPTYSSVPMSVFFFVGLGGLLYSLKRSKEWRSTETLVLIWFGTTLVLTIFMVKGFSLERYLLPLEIPMILVSAYGVFVFLNMIPSNFAKIILAAYFVFVHAITALSYWDKIYFSPGTTWVNPLHYGTLQQSLDNPFTFWANIIFLLIFVGISFCSRKITKLGHAGPNRDVPAS